MWHDGPHEASFLFVFLDVQATTPITEMVTEVCGMASNAM